MPNLFRLVSLSPAALEGYLSLSGALGKGALPVATRERIAVAVAQINRCGYCLRVASARFTCCRFHCLKRLVTNLW